MNRGGPAPNLLFDVGTQGQGQVGVRASSVAMLVAVALATGCTSADSSNPFSAGDPAGGEAGAGSGGGDGGDDGGSDDAAVAGSSSGGGTTGAAPGDGEDTSGGAPGSDEGGESTGDPPTSDALDQCRHTWDFAGCTGEWETGKATASAPGDVSWACGDPPAAVSLDGTHTGVWATNIDDRYNEEESSYLLSPAFDLSACAGATVYLAVAHTYEFGGGDGGTIQISLDDGISWETVEPTWNGYCPGVLSTVGEPSGEPGFCGGDYEAWTHSLVELDAFAGEPQVRIRFVFGSDGILEQEGWYIDSVLVEAYP